MSSCVTDDEALYIHNRFKINKVFAICSGLCDALTRTELNFSPIFFLLRSFSFLDPNISYFIFVQFSFAFLFLSSVLCVVLCRIVETFPEANSLFQLSIECLCICAFYRCGIRLYVVWRFSFIIIIICCNFSSLNKFSGGGGPVRFWCFPFLIDDQPQPNESWLLLAFFLTLS